MFPTPNATSGPIPSWSAIASTSGICWACIVFCWENEFCPAFRQGDPGTGALRLRSHIHGLERPRGPGQNAAKTGFRMHRPGSTGAAGARAGRSRQPRPHAAPDTWRLRPQRGRLAVWPACTSTSRSALRGVRTAVSIRSPASRDEESAPATLPRRPGEGTRHAPERLRPGDGLHRGRYAHGTGPAPFRTPPGPGARRGGRGRAASGPARPIPAP